MEYQYNDGLEFDPQADLDHDWVHVGCTKNLSPNRPPNLNLDNCPSSQAGTPVNDPNPAAQVSALSMPMDNLHLDERPPFSYPSSSKSSVPTLDGPETRDPADQFLPIAPATGLNEMQHRRRASYDDVQHQLSYSLRKWAKDSAPAEPPFRASWEGMQGHWLQLDPHIVGPSDSVRATRGKSSGSASALHSSAYSGASSGWRNPSIDLVSGSGHWVEESALSGWPMYIDEEAFEEEDD